MQAKLNREACVEPNDCMRGWPRPPETTRGAEACIPEKASDRITKHRIQACCLLTSASEKPPLVPAPQRIRPHSQVQRNIPFPKAWSTHTWQAPPNRIVEIAINKPDKRRRSPNQLPGQDGADECISNARSYKGTIRRRLLHARSTPHSLGKSERPPRFG